MPACSAAFFHIRRACTDALHYYEQAAEQGRAEALSMLGELLYEGKGVRRSAVQALSLIHISRPRAWKPLMK